MIRVTVPNLPIRIQPYISKKDGSPQQLRLQTAYLHTVDQDDQPLPYPEKVELFVRNDEQPLQAGEYTFRPSAITVRDGRPSFDASRIMPLKPKAAAQG